MIEPQDKQKEEEEEEEERKQRALSFDHLHSFLGLESVSHSHTHRFISLPKLKNNKQTQNKPFRSSQFLPHFTEEETETLASKQILSEV